MPTNLEWHCAGCGGETHVLSYRWRPPKKNNDSAWKLIESGDWMWDKRLLDRISMYQRNALANRWARNIEDYEATTRLLQEIAEVMDLKDMAKVFNSDVKHVKRWVNGGGVPRKLNWRISHLKIIVDLVNDKKRLHDLAPAIREAFWGTSIRYWHRTHMQVLEPLGLWEEYKEYNAKRQNQKHSV